MAMRYTQPQAGPLEASRPTALLWNAANPTNPVGQLASGGFIQQGTPTRSIGGRGVQLASSGDTLNNRFTGGTFNPVTLNWPGVTVVASFVFVGSTLGSAPGLASLVAVGEYYGGFNLTLESDGISGYFPFWRVGDSPNGLSPSSYSSAGAPALSTSVQYTIVGSWDLLTTRLLLIGADGTNLFNSNAHAFSWRNLDSLAAVLGYERSGYRTIVSPTQMVGVLPVGSTGPEMRRLAANPWQLFEAPRRVLRAASGGTVPGVATGALAAVGLSSVSASAAGRATSSGAIAGIALSAPAASAKGGASAAGPLASMGLAAPSASAVGNSATTPANASGVIAPMAVVAPGATASGRASVASALARVYLLAPMARAQGDVITHTAIAADVSYLQPVAADVSYLQPVAADVSYLQPVASI